MCSFASQSLTYAHVLVGHLWIFGAVCHPELAFIEQIWAATKAHIRPDINDTDSGLVKLIVIAFTEVISSKVCCANARHCRDAMHAYRALRATNALCDPAAVSNHMQGAKTHRVPYASATAGLMTLAGISQTDAMLKKANTAAMRKKQTNSMNTKADKDAAKRKSLKRKMNTARANDMKLNKQ